MDACITWPGRLDKDGYGVISVGGHNRAHRLIYSLFVGQIPPGMGVLHSCDNPRCVNPKHLRYGTPAENTQDRIVRNRQKRNKLAKLKDSDVRLIRGGMSCAEAMAQFGIRKSSYYAARRGENYRYLDIPHRPGQSTPLSVGDTQREDEIGVGESPGPLTGAP